MRSASSTASRTANSLAAMSVMYPRFTPRLSRCPVPSTVSRPSPSGRPIIALTFDEPMSRTAINCCSAGAATGCCLSLLRLRHWDDRLTRGAREAHDHLPGNAQIEADDPASDQPGRFVEPGELHERGAGGLLALRQRESLARLQ